MEDISYDVRCWDIETRKNAKGKITSYRVSWKVSRRLFHESFKTKALADSFRSELRAAANKAEPFSVSTGRPISWAKTTVTMSWYDLAVAYSDRKWKDASAKHRADVARVMMLTTMAVLSSDRGKPDDVLLRRALTRYAFNAKQREQAPSDVASALEWAAKNTEYVETFEDVDVIHTVLDKITTRQRDGKRMAAVTTKKYRGILHNALEFAVVKKALAINPLTGLKWVSIKTSSEVDRRSVMNPAQGRAFLEAVKEQAPSGPRLVALYGSMLYCGLRPEEAVEITEDTLVLQPRIWNPETEQLEDPPEDEDWGELWVGAVAPEVAPDWTDDGAKRDRREMPKHRAQGEIRGPIPVPPVQSRLLREHLVLYGTGKDGRLFRGVRADSVPGDTIRKVFGRARAKVLTKKELASPLAKRPYDLRHTYISTLLNAGVPPKQVAEWAGNSVEVLLKTYTKCLVGDSHAARHRITEALRR
ncbi:tyrosine-type recombinase/integrase [Thermomonospora umbrina]|uniref:Phage integrase family protein n=1 Tax=Thermomonospora umbrina TaxID=111806 RepID=A0A3D9T180_9ACTN|nr:tyrosine-type recombinase/integrase [Thermomonospora umbrina]REE99005.1 phage integrase family protein [Thermomonospora umbrina]